MGPQGAPWGPMGPHGAPWAPRGAPEGTGGAPEAPGAPQRLWEHFWDFPDFGLPGAPPASGPGPAWQAFSRLVAAFSGLAAALDGLAAALDGLAAAAAGPAAAPSFCLRFSCVASGGFFPPKNDMFRKKVTCTSKKKVLREGSPEPGTPLDRRGP